MPNKNMFGEMETENGKSVFKTPKYLEAKAKAVLMLETEYKDILGESDFWILKNNTKAGGIMYSGLIISHNGCLKINDHLAEEKKFRSECLTLDKDGWGGELVYTYNCPEQKMFEVGEVSKSNCKNEYPYAMALKRCFDRVVLKNSKVAYAGIYSDSEADEFSSREAMEEKAVKEAVEKTSTDLPISVDEVATLMEKLTAANVNIPKLLEKYGAKDYSDLKQSQFAHIKKQLEKVGKW